MRILIISSMFDADAQMVQWGLRQLGCSVCILDWSKYPAKQSSTLTISTTAGPKLDFLDDEVAALAPFDVIWYRRPGAPTPDAPAGTQDFNIIHTEAMLYLRNIGTTLGHAHTFWVNPIASAQQAEQKVLQLMTARQVGFTIPETLISNSPARVRAFFDTHEGNIIYKAFAPGKWRNEDGSATILRTAALSKAHLANDLSISACPGIYQANIQKAYELRITVIGDTILTGKIDSQTNGASVDWRYDGRLKDIPLSAFSLSAEIATKCHALVRALNLVFGCIDLIVGEDGRATFLEINQAGQFLWVENYAPSLLMLDTFCRFLARDGSSHNTTPQHILTPAAWVKTADFSQFQARKLVARQPKN